MRGGESRIPQRVITATQTGSPTFQHLNANHEMQSLNEGIGSKIRLK